MTHASRWIFTVALVTASAALAPLAAQDLRPLDHTDYDRWERITSRELSANGRWLAWTQAPGKGNPTLYLSAVDGSASWTFERASDPEFAGDGALVFTIHPDDATVDSLRRADVARDELPPDTLGVVDLGRLAAAPDDAEALVLRVAGLESYRVDPSGAPRVAVRITEPVAPEANSDEDPGDAASSGDDADAADAGPVLLLDPLGGSEFRFEHVTDYEFSGDGQALWLLVDAAGDASDGAIRVDVTDGSMRAVDVGSGRYTALAVQPEGARVAFLVTPFEADDDAGADRDTAAEASDLAADVDTNDDRGPTGAQLHVADATGPARRIAGPGSSGLATDWWIPGDAELRVSDTGRRVFFGARPPVVAPDPELERQLPEEEVEVDIWSWTDGFLQPMQKVRLAQDSARTYLAWAPFDGGEVRQLERPDLPQVRLDPTGDANVLLGLDDRPYRQLMSWDASYDDLYAVDTETGRATRVAQQVRWMPSLSPEGDRVVWFDGVSGHWMTQAIDTALQPVGEVVSLSVAIPHPVHDELNDRPDGHYPEAAARWTDDGRVLLNDRYDLWVVDPRRPEDARAVTEGVGRRSGLRFRVIDPDPSTPLIEARSELHLTAFHLTEKTGGIWRDRIDGSNEPVELRTERASLSPPLRAADADVFVYSRETFRDFPDLWVAGPDFTSPRQLSAANPWQSEYLWGDAQLVEWTSADGERLQGILYTPDGFDPTRQYPMMVYFYERLSDGLYGYHVPSAGSSSINRSFYVSRGYVLFVPDIPYEIGHPGESALDAIVPGVQAIVSQGFIDPARIGLQGHSWGGYQIAWMVTRTNLFAAAEAGAPVVNMTSAYGGIRWGTGMSRMFQYERTQSRIGGTLWEKPLLYLQNSPLFMLDKVETPLLWMHNDADTAVPWEQGIELFVALRRLGKPAWMINYNGEPHGLRKEANRRDFAVRMQQFFDHYLKSEPAPVWMIEGVPAVLKGRTLGLDLTEDGVVPERAPGAGVAGGGR